MNRVDAASKAVGWAFLIIAAAILLQPQGHATKAFSHWRYERRARDVARTRWDELSRNGSLLGASTARARVIEFIDYKCPYCRQFNDTATLFLARNPDASIVVRHAPRPGDAGSRAAAIAAICAAEQGRFEAMHSYLLSDTAWFADSGWVVAARNVKGLDAGRFSSCRGSARARALLAVDSGWVNVFALRATPVFVSRESGLHIGLASSALLKKWLDDNTQR